MGPRTDDPRAARLLDPRGELTPASLFLLIHSALRRDAERFSSAAARCREAAHGADLAEHWATYAALLRGHHEQEDAVLFPAIVAARPDLAPEVASLDHDHAQLDPHLRRVDRLMGGLPERAEEVTAAVADLAAVVEAHLDREEVIVVPLLLDGVVAIGPGAEAQEPAPRPAPEPDPVPPEVAWPWVLDGQPAEVRAALLGGGLPVSAEEVTRWEVAYAERAQRCWDR